jgi:MerR family copper efflux transcriptional regulator
VGGESLKIGELALRTGVSPKAIRFYEAAGVLPPPARGANGYRLYAAEAAGMLGFIRQAQGLGLTLAEIKEIVAIRQGGRPPCRHVYRLLREKAVELDRKLRDLVTLRRRVRQSLRAWGRAQARGAAVCPHIEASRRPSRRGASRAG